MVEESWSPFYEKDLAESQQGVPVMDIAYKEIYAMNKLLKLTELLVFQLLMVGFVSGRSITGL